LFFLSPWGAFYVVFLCKKKGPEKKTEQQKAPSLFFVGAKKSPGKKKRKQLRSEEKEAVGVLFFLFFLPYPYLRRISAEQKKLLRPFWPPFFSILFFSFDFFFGVPTANNL